MRYALVEDVTNKILEEVEGDKEFRTGTPPDLPQKPFRWLPIEVTNPDLLDHETHMKDGPLISVKDDSVTKVWTIRPRTAQELDDVLEGKLPLNDSIEFKAMLDMENRTLALEKKPKLTAAKYRASLKALL